MKNVEKKFMAESDEYQTRVFEVANAILTLSNIDEIKSCTLQIKEEDSKFENYVEFILDSIGEEDEDNQEEDYDTNDAESDVLTEKINEVKELVAISTEMMSTIMDEVKDMKIRMQYTEKAVVKLIKASR